MFERMARGRAACFQSLLAPLCHSCVRAHASHVTGWGATAAPGRFPGPPEVPAEQQGRGRPGPRALGDEECTRKGNHVNAGCFWKHLGHTGTAWGFVLYLSCRQTLSPVGTEAVLVLVTAAPRTCPSAWHSAGLPGLCPLRPL